MTEFTRVLRSLTIPLRDGGSFFPASRHHNAIVSGHQQVTDVLTFTVDGIFNEQHLVH